MYLRKFIISFFWLTSSICFGADVLVVRFETEEMKSVADTLRSDLKGVSISELIIDHGTDYAEFRKAIRAAQPQLVALFDNKAVRFMNQLHTDPDYKDAEKIVGAATMALNLKYLLKDSRHIFGIAYEVPPFTIVTKFRSLTRAPIKNVLAPYRKSEFDAYITEAQKQLKRENINLLAVNVDDHSGDQGKINKQLFSQLTDQVEGEKIDAILIPSDNVLVSKNSLLSVWLAKSRELKIPFLCNIDKFASRDFDLCTFAAFPDFSDLGHQLAEQISEHLTNHTSVLDLGVDYIVASRASINLPLAKKLNLAFDSKQLELVKKYE